MADAVAPTPTPTPSAPALRTWTAPRLAELPKLSRLTLASPIGGGGGTGGGGSTVFGILFALLTLAGCSAERATGPGERPMPAPVAAVSCHATVATREVKCDAPAAAPGTEILGGQGVRVALRSDNVDYDSGDELFFFNVTLQNLTPQTLGTDGTQITGIRVFFEQAPVVTAGSGTITPIEDSIGTFTAPGQHYYLFNDSLAMEWYSTPVPWGFLMPPTVAEFSFTVLVAAEVAETGGILRWRKLPDWSSSYMNDIARWTDTDQMAVGQRGVTMHWDGSTWTHLTPVTSSELVTVVAVGPNAYFATDANGGIYRNKGNLWSLVYQHPSFVKLTHGWANGGDAIFAGEEGAGVLYTSGLFNEFNVPTGGEDVAALAGDPATGTVIAATSDGDAFQIVSGVWTPSAFDLAADGSRVTSLAIVGSNVYIGILDNGNTRGYITTHLGDTVYNSAAKFPTDLFGMGGDSMVAALEIFGGTPATTLEKFTDLTGTATHTDLGGGDVAYAAEAGKVRLGKADGSQWYLPHVWSGAGIYVWNGVGSGFVPAWPSPGHQPFIVGAGDTAWMATSYTDLLKIVNGSVTQYTLPVASYVIWRQGPGEFYIGDDQWLYTGSDLGAMAVDGGPGPMAAQIRAIWGDTATGFLLVGEEGGIVHTRSGGVWQSHTDPGLANLTAAWGCSEDQVWLMDGDLGQIFLLKDGVLGPDTAFSNNFPPFSQPLWAVTGTSCNDVWAAGDNGTMYHWNGSTWQDLTQTGTTTQYFRALTPIGPGEVYAAGQWGELNRYNAAGGISNLRTTSQGSPIYGLWRFADGDLLIGATDEIIWGTR